MAIASLFGAFPLRMRNYEVLQGCKERRPGVEWQMALRRGAVKGPVISATMALMAPMLLGPLEPLKGRIEGEHETPDSGWGEWLDAADMAVFRSCLVPT